MFLLPAVDANQCKWAHNQTFLPNHQGLPCEFPLANDLEEGRRCTLLGGLRYLCLVSSGRCRAVNWGTLTVRTTETGSADEAEGDETMETVKIAEYARALLDAHGDKAEAEAAQKASALKAEGKAGEAQQWEKVRKAIHELRSGHMS
jgi:hypothetical protein